MTENRTSTDHARTTYAPQPDSRRAGVGLCLSGGGFRATLFHLGALRRLNEVGLLQKVTTFSAVSGGSIAAAHLATVLEWPLKGVVTDWESRVAAPLRAFARNDIRTAAVLRGILPTQTAVELLARRYEALTKLKLSELPKSPNFIFCATEMAYGVNWTFERSRMGDYQIGYIRPAPKDWPLAKAVAASSCFPPIFNPLPLTLDPGLFKGGRAVAGKVRDDCIRNLRLTDGGNYDNMGLEPVWKDHRVVFVSDGGGTFDSEGDRNLMQRLLRYTAIIDRQAIALRKRWLISSFISGVMRGAYWGIGSSPSSYKQPGGYSKELAAELISEIRTDLDSFSEAESAVLENHGYHLADAAIARHAGDLRSREVPAAVTPHPEWMDEARVRDALRDSGKRKWLGRK